LQIICILNAGLSTLTKATCVIAQLSINGDESCRFHLCAYTKDIKVADTFLKRVIQGLAAMRKSGFDINISCPLFREPTWFSDAMLAYDWPATAGSFSFSLDKRLFRFQMTFYELLDDHGRYFPDEPCRYGHLYSHPGQQGKKAYRKASIAVSSTVIYQIKYHLLTYKVDERGDQPPCSS
jgi:hypothetical protein